MNMDRGFKAIEKQETPLATIRLEITRHAQKGSVPEGGEDKDIRLTDKGRLSAVEAGKTRNLNPEIAVAGASLRDRTIETALRQLLANQDITPAMSLEDLRKLVAENMGYGRKYFQTEKLDFDYDSIPEFHEIETLVYDAGRNIPFMYEESDDCVIKLFDQKSTSYSRLAANIAEIVKHYTKILPTWQKVVTEDQHRPEPKGYAKYNNELQRILGSGGGAIDCFLMKVIEKIEGPRGVQEFIDSLPDKNGIGFNEGCSIIIKQTDPNDPETVSLVIKFRDKEWIVGPEMIDDIINDRVVLDQKIADLKKQAEGK